MVLICLTNFKTGVRGYMNNRCMEPLENDCYILNNLSLSLEERLFKSQVDYENFVFSQELGSILNSSLCVEPNNKTTSIGEGALISLNLILKLWEKNAKVRKMYLSDFIRGINIDMPNPNSLSNLFFDNLIAFITQYEGSDMKTYRSLELLIECLKTQKILFDDFLKYDPSESSSRHQQSYFVSKIGNVIKKISDLNINMIMDQRNILPCVSKITELVSLILQREDIRNKF